MERASPHALRVIEVEIRISSALPAFAGQGARYPNFPEQLPV
jgi:hypothetical protein